MGEDILCLISDGFQCRADDVIASATSSKSYDRATGIHIPMRCAESCESRHDINTAVIGKLACKISGIGGISEETELIAQPLNDGTTHENATRTMLYNIHTLDWDDELLALLNIPRNMLPEVKASADDFGTLNLLGSEIPIRGVAGDQQAALFGQGCFSAGDAKNTYGTGCFLLANIGEKPLPEAKLLINTLAATEKGRPAEYALEGSVFVGGAVIQWLRDELGFLRDAADSAYFASKLSDNGGVYVVPAFTGLGAPHWDMYARGTIVGLTRGSGRNHIIRAALEAIAYQTEDILSHMGNALGTPLHTLKVDGGATRNPFLMQFQADISHLPVVRAASAEATALGAAFLAGLSVGFWKDRDELSAIIQTAETFTPHMDDETRAKNLAGWRKAVSAAIYHAYC